MLLLILCTVGAIASSADLPEIVAVHFDAKHHADAWIARDEYRILMVLVLIGLPLILVGIFAWLPRITGGKGQIPDHEYWFAENRRHETEAFLLQHSCWLGSLTVAVVYGLQLFIERANTATPPTLSADQLAVTLLIYLFGLGWWLTRFLAHFRKR